MARVNCLVLFGNADPYTPTSFGLRNSQSRSQGVRGPRPLTKLLLGAFSSPLNLPCYVLLGCKSVGVNDH